MQFIKTPNIPQKRVKAVLISESAGEGVIKSIENRGIEPVIVHSCADIAKPVSSHPDMLFHHLGGSKMLYYKNADKGVKNRLAEMGFDMIPATHHLKTNYPYDIALNSVRIGSNLFCLQKYTDKVLLDYCENRKIHIINVRQGYSKCSVCVVDEKSIITADKSIAKRAQECSIDTLTIESGFVRLEGYTEGFIGGCCGKTDKNKILFVGDLRKHKNYSQMKSFLDKRKIEIECIGEGNLNDVGSIIPLIEE